MKKLFLILLAASAVAIMSFAAIQGYKPGDEVKPFSLINVDGKMISLDGNKRVKGYIIVFTCNHCPFAKLYQDRLNEINTEYAPKGMPVLAISSNDAEAVPEDGFQEMRKRAREKNYNFPYLYDSTQEVARAFGAMKTPHAFVVAKEGGKWILKYSGAIDDNGAEPAKVKQRFVADAADAVLHGRLVAVTSTRSVGCGIKWKQ